MKKLILLLCIIVAAGNSTLKGKHIFNEAEAQSQKKIVIELDFPNNGSVPPLTLFYNGQTTKNNSAGFAQFPAPAKLPSKWYFLLTQNCEPLLSPTKQVVAFKIPESKKYAYYSSTWDHENERWKIKKKDLSLRKNILPKADNTIIIKISPTFSTSLKAPTCSRSYQETGAVILLPKIVLCQQVGNKHISKNINKSALPDALLRFNRPVLQETIINDEGKTRLHAFYIKE